MSKDAKSKEAESAFVPLTTHANILCFHWDFARDQSVEVPFVLLWPNRCISLLEEQTLPVRAQLGFLFISFFKVVFFFFVQLLGFHSHSHLRPFWGTLTPYKSTAVTTGMGFQQHLTSTWIVPKLCSLFTTLPQFPAPIWFCHSDALRGGSSKEKKRKKQLPRPTSRTLESGFTTGCRHLSMTCTLAQAFTHTT